MSRVIVNFFTAIILIMLTFFNLTSGIDQAAEILNRVQRSTGNNSVSSDILVDDEVTWPSGTNDSCMEDTLALWYEDVRYDYFQYFELTANMFSSRSLYQTLFTLSFDATSLGQYCKVYKALREELDRCPNSPNKMAILNGFTLGDYFCLERFSDYVATMPCMVNQEALGAFSSCDDGFCPEYDASPSVYTNPIEPFAVNETIVKMALDCRYLQCDIDCRYPIILKQCGKVAASFVLDSLARTFQGVSTGLRADTQNKAVWAGFPDDCRKLMHVASDTPVDNLTRPVEANSTTKSILISTIAVIVTNSTKAAATNAPVSSTQIATTNGTTSTASTTAAKNSTQSPTSSRPVVESTTLGAPTPQKAGTIRTIQNHNCFIMFFIIISIVRGFDHA